MSKTFHFEVQHPEKMMMLADILGKGNGQLQGGRFIWMGIEGIYHMNEKYLDLDITRRPPFTSWEVIESNLKKFFKQIHLL
jgi:hypothetical protein